MTKTDMALAQDLSGYMNADNHGNRSKVSCVYKVEMEAGGSTDTRQKSVQSTPVVCPVAHDTVAIITISRLTANSF